MSYEGMAGRILAHAFWAELEKIARYAPGAQIWQRDVMRGYRTFTDPLRVVRQADEALPKKTLGLTGVRFGPRVESPDRRMRFAHESAKRMLAAEKRQEPVVVRGGMSKKTLHWRALAERDARKEIVPALLGRKKKQFGLRQRLGFAEGRPATQEEAARVARKAFDKKHLPKETAERLVRRQSEKIEKKEVKKLPKALLKAEKGVGPKKAARLRMRHEALSPEAKVKLDQALEKL